MEMKKIILAIASVISLSACTSINLTPTTSETDSTTQSSETDTTSSTSQDQTSSEEDGNNDSQTSGGDVNKEAYKINIKNTNENITITTDKAKATAGEKVTITATVTNQQYILKGVFVDGEPCSKVNATTYTFIMPDHAVFITCTVDIASGDVKLVGKLTAVFAKENNVYVARDVKVDEDSEFNFVVKQGQEEVNMGITKFDRSKTFANIEFTQGHTPYSLKIDGGATYDFYYDPANGDRPCYVIRTKVNNLPSSSDGLYRLFNGTIGMETSVLPQNLVKTVFKNSLTNETLTWNAYKDNSSYASITKPDTDGNPVLKSVVFNKINGNELTVVDTFAPGVAPAYKDNIALQGDDIVYSGQYLISDTLPNGEKTNKVEFRYKTNYVDQNIANMCVQHSPITMEAYESEIMDAYRVGYQVEGGTTQANAKVTSSLNEDETFDVKIVSSKTKDSTQDRNSGALLQTHMEYRVDLKFSKAGALLSSTYASKSYAEGEYDFKRLQFVNGTVEENWEQKGTTLKNLSIANTYGDATLDSCDFDSSPYLVNEVKNISIVNKDITDKDGNRLNLGDRLTITEDEKTSTVTFDVLPTTALNKFQYKVNASDNEEVVKNINGYWTANKEGSANITIGIDNNLGVKSSANVTVYCTYLIRSLYLYDEQGRYPNITGTQTGKMYTKSINKYRIETKESKGNKTVPIPKDLTPVITTENYGIVASIDYEAQEIILDATNATAKGGEIVKVALQTNLYDKGWIPTPIVMTFTVEAKIDADVLLGKWVISGGYDISVTFTNEPSNDSNAKYPYKGSLKDGSDVYDFYYGFDPMANSIKLKLVDDELSLSTFAMIYDSTNNTLSVIFVIKKWVNPPVEDVEVLGYEDEAGDHYEVFNKEGENNA